MTMTPSYPHPADHHHGDTVQNCVPRQGQQQPQTRQQPQQQPLPQKPQQQQQSMTIDEMRILHRTAIVEAEAKRTELRLVLASRYRELVGSSVEVIHMRERADELNDLVVALPALVEKVAESSGVVEETTVMKTITSVNTEATGTMKSLGESFRNRKSEVKEIAEGGPLVMGDTDVINPSQYRGDFTGRSASSLVGVHGELSHLPRDIHRCLVENSVHGAAATLISLFDVISSRSDSFPLATVLSSSVMNLAHTQILEKRDTNSKTNSVAENDSHKASCISNSNATNHQPLETQMKMVYLHVQTLPARIVKLARQALLQSAVKRGTGAHATAAALSALDLLDNDPRKRLISTAAHMPPACIPSSIASESSFSRGNKLIDLYYDSKAQLLAKLLNKLTLPSVAVGGASSRAAVDAVSVTNAAEIILSKIVLILQYDVILHPYQIFVLRKFLVNETKGGGSDCTVAAVNASAIIKRVMSTLPNRFDPDVLKSKASRFLAAHLPLIRTKVKSVLVIIAGTTASKLGHIRQVLYDKTDGAECMVRLDESGICTWDEAVSGMVDIRVVSHGTSFATMTLLKGPERSMDGLAHVSSQGGATITSTRRFSLWGALFSTTFSSLVHSLLTSSFHSVHVRAMSTLRLSLARAPPFEAILPHEAHQNALRIASDLDVSLRKVSDDAHKLLVHAEEREESEQRLRQSLYVQTCEIMGRLLNELRRMLVVRRQEGEMSTLEEETTKQDKEDATKVLIVGRLCHLLKFRLWSLPTLLDPMSSPAILAAGSSGCGGTGAIKSSSGMITLVELRGSFDLADDDDNGLISFDEAMEAMESAFSGTHFHGAEMVRDTLLLTHSSAPGNISGVGKSSYTSGSCVSSNMSNGIARRDSGTNVTLSELALLSARGLLHDASGPESALGTVQSSLDDIVHRCFQKWAQTALSQPLALFAKTMRERICVASMVSDMEWRQLNNLVENVNYVSSKEKTKSEGNMRGGRRMAVVGEVSPCVTSYMLAVASVLNRSVCPADSLPPVPSLEYARALGISLSSASYNSKEIPNMVVLIRGSLLGEAIVSLSQSLKQEIKTAADDEDNNGGVFDNNKSNHILRKFSPSSLIHFNMDVQFIKRCFFEKNHHDFLLGSNSVSGSLEIINKLSEYLDESMNNALKDGLSSPSSSEVKRAISERHLQVFTSCDLFLSSLLGEDENTKSAFGFGDGVTINRGMAVPVLPSSQPFIITPFPSSRRFILLPIQSEKSLTELQLRGKYGKKGSQEKGANSSHSKDAVGGLGTGFGFLSSMLTKTR